MPRPACQQCLRPPAVCYCHTIQTVCNQWPVYILQHPKEVSHAIGTARIAQLSLQVCETTIAETPEQQKAFEEQLIDTQPLLVYPGEYSQSVVELDKNTVRPLVFLDGSWRKTRRMLHESNLLASLPRITTPMPLSRYKIRKEPVPEAVSTVEAIVEVLGILEQDSDKFQPLLNTMDWMIAQQIEKMGETTFRNNYGDKT